ncbi:fibroblast growth factor-binding protein 1-like [Channa argus]|uniref:fibroblast growth factor-binding protein 1-like n=1 Tax=Channa argus TaxID=215402 RepID=UPI0029440790|nr:hypothetical protein Q8A73_003172 [Channa argus]
MKTTCRRAERHKDTRSRFTHSSCDNFSADMLLLRTFAPWLLLGFLGGQVTAAPGRAQRLGDKAAETGRGKFTTRDQMQCTWASRDVGDTVKLSVKCENPEARHSSLMCQYVAKPRSCPGYLSEPRAFWKQVARALKKLQGKVCTDERALVKAGMCKRAPFKLDRVTAAATDEPPAPGALEERPASAAPTACTGRADHRKTAEEYCKSSWASVCSFLFSMLQRDC